MRTLRIAPFAAVLLFALCALLGAATTVHASAPVFVAEPEPGPDTTLGYFRIEIAPGTTVSQSVRLRNPGAETIVIHAAAVDTDTASLGGVSYDMATSKPAAAGKWIELDRQSVKLPPSQSARLSFSVTVPADVGPGDHVGGLALWVESKQKDATGSSGAGKAGASVSVQTRRIIAVQLVTPGALDPALEVQGVQAIGRPAGMYLDVAIAGVGTQLTGDGTLHLDLPGREFAYDGALGTSVPGTNMAYPVQWTTQPEDGVYPAHVVLTYAGKTTEWTGEFRVGSEQQEQLTDRLVGEETSSGGHKTIILIAVATLAGLIVVGVLIGRRPRRT